MVLTCSSHSASQGFGFQISRRKKSNLKKSSEESQLRVPGWFRGRDRRWRPAPAGVCAAAWVPVQGGRGGAGVGAGSLLGTGDLAGRMPRYERQQSAMAIVHGGDGTVQCGVVAAQAGDAVGWRRMCLAVRSRSRA